MKNTLAKQIAEALFRNGFGSDTRALESMESIIDAELAGHASIMALKKIAPIIRNYCPHCEGPMDCPESHPDGAFCTRPKGHDGPHIACSSLQHNLKQW